LILEELHLDSSGPPADATALYTCPAPAAARPPTPTPASPSRPLSNGGTGKKGKNKKNAGGGRGRGGNSGNTTPTPLAPSGTDAKVPASWPTYVNPWQGHIAMYPGPLPGGLQCPQALRPHPLLPSSGIHTRAAAAGPVLAPGTSQLVIMDWFRLGPAIPVELLQYPGAYSTTHYPGLGG
jgi:hypothetical protein